MDRSVIIGIDPGYDRVGWCVLEADGPKHIFLGSGCIQTLKTDSLFQRYIVLNEKLEEILKTYTPSEAAIENLYFSKNAKTAMRVSEARGIILSCLLRGQIEVHEYTPQEIKSAVTGNGKASKTEVERMILLLTKLEKLPKLDDEIDAIAIAICHGTGRRLRKALSRI